MTTESLEKRKFNLIVQITKLDDEISVRKVEDIIEDLTGKEKLLHSLVKPLRKKTDIEQIKKEQNWKGVDRKKFDRLIKEIDIQEPLEQLLSDIGK